MKTLKDIDILIQKSKKGDPESQCQLGICYDISDGILKASKKATYWFRKAANQGDIDAQCYPNFAIIGAEVLKWIGVKHYYYLRNQLKMAKN